MKNEKVKYSRKHFIKGLSAAAITSFILSTGYTLSGSFAAQTGHSHRIMSCNIRVALPEDDAKGVGWSDRKDICLDIIKKRMIL